MAEIFSQVSAAEEDRIRAEIDAHPSVHQDDRLGGRRAIRRLYGLPGTVSSTRQLDGAGRVKGSRHSSDSLLY